MNEVFSYRLHQLRVRRKISCRTVAELCGMSKSTLSRYENGERCPNLAHAALLADFFGVSLDYLAGREKEPKFFSSVPK